jgi:hypothetical protein
MPKKRELSRAEQQFISENYKSMTPEELCSDMPGVGVKTVQEFIDTIPDSVPNETQEERTERLQKTPAGRTKGLFGRDEHKRSVVMTEAASMMADAHKGRNVPTPKKTAKKQSDRIHIINDKEKVV